MRTPLLIIASLSLAASVAAAANFDINAANSQLDDLSVGTSSIDDCTAGLNLDIVPGTAYQDDIDDWLVDSVRVSSANPATDLLDTCGGLALSVAIDDATDTNLTVLGPVVLTADSISGGIIDLPIGDSTDIPVADATSVSALVELDQAAVDALVPTVVSLDGPGATYGLVGSVTSNPLGRVFSPTADMSLSRVDLEIVSCPGGAFMEFTVTELPDGSLPIAAGGDSPQIAADDMTYLMDGVAPTSIANNGPGAWSPQELAAPVALTAGAEYFVGVRTNCNMAFTFSVPAFSTADATNVESAYIYYALNLRWTNTELAMQIG